MVKLGFDLSHWEGEPRALCDFNKAKAAGIEWVSLNVTDGLAKDKAYKANWAGLAGAGIKIMPYHWFFFSSAYYPPIQQAQNFITSLIEQNYNPLEQLPPMIDLENYGTNLAYVGCWKNIKIFADEVERAFGVIPVLYSSPSFFSTYLYNSSAYNDDLRRYPFLAAHYRVPSPLIPLPYHPYEEKYGWQFDDKANAGIYGFDTNKVKQVALQFLY